MTLMGDYIIWILGTAIGCLIGKIVFRVGRTENDD